MQQIRTSRLFNPARPRAQWQYNNAFADKLTADIYHAHQREWVLRQWKDLEQRVSVCPLVCSWDWTELWLQHYGDLVPHHFIVGRRGGHICGLCLVTEGIDQWDGPVPVKSIHLGTAGEPDAHSVCVQYNAVLAEERDRTAFLQAIIERLKNWPSMDELCLDGFPLEDIEALDLNANLWRLQKRISHYFDLKAARDTGGEPLKQLGSSTRKTLRKNLKEYKHVTCQWGQSLENAGDIFDDMVQHHQARWQERGKSGAYASPRFYSFHHCLLKRLLPQGRAALFRVKGETNTIGVVHLLIDRGRVLCYQGGTAPYTGKTSPGLVVDYLCLKECLQRGFDAYDFLAGDSHHKRRLSTRHRVLVWAWQRRRRAKFVLLDLGRAIKRHLLASQLKTSDDSKRGI